MRWNDRKPKELPATSVRFIAEQVGEGERLLTEALATLFRKSRRIASAYLAKAAVDGTPTVVLALRTLNDHEDQRLLDEVQQTFAGMFNKSQHLDIMFVSKDQESELEAVCRPFFVNQT